VCVSAARFLLGLDRRDGEGVVVPLLPLPGRGEALGDLHEEGLDVGGGPGRRLEVEDVVLGGVRRGLLGLDLALGGGKVGLVACEGYDDVRVSPAQELLHPRLRAVVRVLVGEVEDDNGGGGAAVVHGGEGPVALLAGGVPDLELDDGGVELDGLGEEGRSDGGLLELEELVPDEADDEARLADGGVAEEDEFKVTHGHGIGN